VADGPDGRDLCSQRLSYLGKPPRDRDANLNGAHDLHGSDGLAISEAAFDAIAATMPLGSVGYEAEVVANGEQLIWLARNVVDRLKPLRGPGESNSDVILRLASGGEPREGQNRR
jgi:hypothetical protein